MNTLSYTSAGMFPWKVLKHYELLAAAKRGRILPIHAQFIPTNKCNMSCDMCSCKKRDKRIELDFEQAEQIIQGLARLGCKAVTITGGGEPLMHPKLADIVQTFQQCGIEVGLVSNGKLLGNALTDTLRALTWCRISNDDSRTFSRRYDQALQDVVMRAPTVDWAFSHVVSKTPNLPEIQQVVKFANKWKFTHVRLVSDLFIANEVDQELVREDLKDAGISDDRVIYQARREFTQGGDCWIGFFKPLIGPDGNVYACCGVQYALDPPSYDLPEELCLGSALDLDEIFNRSDTPLDGSICKKCYYAGYNELLEGIVSSFEHENFG